MSKPALYCASDRCFLGDDIADEALSLRASLSSSSVAMPGQHEQKRSISNQEACGFLQLCNNKQQLRLKLCRGGSGRSSSCQQRFALVLRYSDPRQSSFTPGWKSRKDKRRQTAAYIHRLICDQSHQTGPGAVCLQIEWCKSHVSDDNVVWRDVCVAKSRRIR